MIYNAKDLRDKKLSELKDKVAKLDKQPVLAVVMVGDNPASQTYVKNKHRIAMKAGIKSYTVELNKNCSQETLNLTLDNLSNYKTVDAILLQLPLPYHLNEFEALSHIVPSKDVDCLTTYNQGLLYQGMDTIKPCTPTGIIAMLDDIGTDINGSNVVVIGRSILVGQPVAKMLQDRGATVTICHSKTKCLNDFIKQADIIVCAVGKEFFLTKDNINSNTTIIDVGINHDNEDNVVGDVDPSIGEDDSIVLSAVPGGVGLMTVESLMENVYKIASLNEANR